MSFPRDPDSALAGAARAPISLPVSPRALQHELLGEHHRLALEAALVEAADPVAAAVLRRRAWVWRATAMRIPDVPTSRFPRWLLDHLERYSSSPVVGDEYRRAHALVAARTGHVSPN